MKNTFLSGIYLAFCLAALGSGTAGPAHAAAMAEPTLTAVVDADESLVLIQASNFAPHTKTFLFFSKVGLGKTVIPRLLVTLELSRAHHAGPPKIASPAGEVNWNPDIPPRLLGYRVWLQAAQRGKFTNVIDLQL